MLAGGSGHAVPLPGPQFLLLGKGHDQSPSLGAVCGLCPRHARRDRDEGRERCSLASPCERRCLRGFAETGVGGGGDSKPSADAGGKGSPLMRDLVLPETQGFLRLAPEKPRSLPRAPGSTDPFGPRPPPGSSATVSVTDAELGFPAHVTVFAGLSRGAGHAPVSPSYAVMCGAS